MDHSLDINRAAGEISPLLFGHNLEHTRSCIWQGLSAQLIRNRKFAGCPQQHNGVALDWYPIASAMSWHLLELDREQWGWDLGLGGEPYTGHFEDRFNKNDHARQRQGILSFGDGEPCGIGQSGLYLRQDQEYEGRVVLLSDRELEARVCLISSASKQIWHEAPISVHLGEWIEVDFRFSAPETDLDARIEIAFDQPGVLYVGVVSLLPADHFHGMRRDVIERLQEISVPILRWPGGNFADDYHWKDGLLPVDRRAPLRAHMQDTLPHTRGYDMHEIGIDEFVALCRELDAEPFVTINMATEEPQDAADWVEYCNGAADTGWGKLRVERGHPEPYKVKRWSLGNEYGYGHMLGPNKPQAYAEAATVYAEAMRGVDESLLLTASGAWWDEVWHQQVLPSAGGHFDSVSYHEYTALVRSFDGDRGEQDFRRTTCAPAAIHRQLSSIRRMLDLYAPRGKRVGISFDEWNVIYAWYRPVGVIEGIYVASMLNFLCRQAQDLGIAHGAYFEPVNEGAILVEADDATLTAVGQVFEVFRPHHGNRLVELTPRDLEADLDIAASLDAAANELVITVVNRSPYESREASFCVNGDVFLEQAGGVLLSSSAFLPGSRFDQSPLRLANKENHRIALELPCYSVAVVQARYKHM